MRLIEAIARSICNKAQAHNDAGQLVIVQERYGTASDDNSWFYSWFHLWIIAEEVSEADIFRNSEAETAIWLSKYQVDPASDYWSPIG